MARLGADVVSARALTALDGLCGYAARHLRPDGIALFHKGASYQDEIHSAEQHWRFRLTPIQSRTDPAAVILKLEDLTHV
jgi:16S rRNA (guanine527-N7)-methyltransferase